MAQITQCENCGAVLAPEDAFCGECGAPRPQEPSGVAEPAATSSAKPVRPAPPPPAPTGPQPTPQAQVGWRVAFFVLIILGAIACLAGVVAFLLFGLTDSESFTPEENWLYATICCLLPIAGSGALLLLGSLGIWYSRLRDR